MTHAEQQLYLRTAGTALDYTAAHRRAIVAAKSHPTMDVAVKLGTVPVEHIAGMSSGEDLWAICRKGRLVTVLLRRRTQPATPRALRVDRVISQ